jgi:hypothetical protein
MLDATFALSLAICNFASHLSKASVRGDDTVVFVVACGSAVACAPPCSTDRASTKSVRLSKAQPAAAGAAAAAAASHCERLEGKQRRPRC